MSLATDFERTLAGPWRTDGKDVQWKLVSTPELIEVSFQGSISLSDWIHNLLVFPWPRKKREQAMEGFVLLWESAQEVVLKAIWDELQKCHRPTFVTGYSQGAGIATLCFRHLYHIGYPISGIGFASPRVFFKRQRDPCYANWTRVTVRGDIVSMLPPWLMGYRHVGKYIKIGPPTWPSAEKHLPASYRKELANVV